MPRTFDLFANHLGLCVVLAADVLEILLRTYASDPEGEPLLQPISHGEFLDLLFSGACKFEWAPLTEGGTSLTPL